MHTHPRRYPHTRVPEEKWKQSQGNARIGGRRPRRADGERRKGGRERQSQRKEESPTELARCQRETVGARMQQSTDRSCDTPLRHRRNNWLPHGEFEEPHWYTKGREERHDTDVYMYTGAGGIPGVRGTAGMARAESRGRHGGKRG